LEIDVGITYLDNEPLGPATTVPLYLESYWLVISEEAKYASRKTVSWKTVSRLPLCLLTPDMQNRRIINQHLMEAGAVATPTLESDSMIALFAHVRTGRWASIMPRALVETFGPWDNIKAIPIVEPEATHLVGLVAAHREPHTPIISTLLQQAKAISRITNAGQ
jgi:DNA-binding transcriptional LysR family regulator